MTEIPIVTPPRRVFSKEEKTALMLLIVAGVGGLFFGFRYIGKNLQTPFSFTYTGSTSLTATEQQTADMEAMKSRDTDSDTLNDYDELYVYKTSAYLADSDSDGFNDAKEIASGNDPNCPEGKTCQSSVAAVDAPPPGGESLLGGLAEPTAPDLGDAQQIIDQSTDSETILKNMTVAQLRELLIANGANKQALDTLADEDLMQLYAETLTQYQTDQGTATSP